MARVNLTPKRLTCEDAVAAPQTPEQVRQAMKVAGEAFSVSVNELCDRIMKGAISPNEVRQQQTFNWRKSDLDVAAKAELERRCRDANPDTWRQDRGDLPQVDDVVDFGCANREDVIAASGEASWMTVRRGLPCRIVRIDPDGRLWLEFRLEANPLGHKEIIPFSYLPYAALMAAPDLPRTWLVGWSRPAAITGGHVGPLTTTAPTHTVVDLWRPFHFGEPLWFIQSPPPYDLFSIAEVVRDDPIPTYQHLRHYRDFASLDDLLSFQPMPGYYATCLTKGAVRLGGEPHGRMVAFVTARREVKVGVDLAPKGMDRTTMHVVDPAERAYREALEHRRRRKAGQLDEQVKARQQAAVKTVQAAPKSEPDLRAANAIAAMERARTSR